tara:strand:+ start:7160 stop:7297 length:138 start_codon:yes stop_codon:yes gene_type:complete
MEKNYFFQEEISLEPKRKTINFILNYSKSIKVLNSKTDSYIIDLN